MEKQIGLLVKLMSERAPGTLPSNTEVKPREHVNTISVRYIEEVPNKEKIVVVQGKNFNKEERIATVVPTIKKVETVQKATNKKSTVEAYKAKIPYLAALVHDHTKDEMKKFMDMF